MFTSRTIDGGPRHRFGIMTTAFRELALERWVSAWEARVRVNLCDSGVAPVTLRELLSLSGGDPEEIASLSLGSPERSGSRGLREAIAGLYPGATVDHVLVTSGSAAGMFLVCWLLIGPGSGVIIPTPSYQQASGLAEIFGAEVGGLVLDMAQGWDPQPAAIRRAIGADTQVVVLTNPHHPTGHALSAQAREAITQRVSEIGAWLIVDESYLGAELRGATPPSMWSEYDRLLIASDFSKTYGLPGVQIGWIVGPPGLIGAVAARHDYTALAPSLIGDRLARQALVSRDALQGRGRRILAHNWPLLEERLRRINARLGDCLSWREPSAGGAVFVRYDRSVASEHLAERMRDEWSVLVAPGDHFGSRQHLRIGFGNDPGHYAGHLDVLERALVHALE
jgi:aspartate/methionine/tyrosine aminotransferase